ncbi:MAG: TrkA C-terminal domain-containing protein [Bacteroidia bacterium]
MLVGSEEEVQRVVQDMGVISNSSLAYDRTLFDRRRIFVSNPEVGRSIASLNLHENYNAVVTRIRRGDMDMLAKSDTVLELGDRIRFIARRKTSNRFQSSLAILTAPPVPLIFFLWTGHRTGAFSWFH